MAKLDPGMFAKISPIGVNFARSMGLDKTELQPKLETRGQTFPRFVTPNF